MNVRAADNAGKHSRRGGLCRRLLGFARRGGLRCRLRGFARREDGSVAVETALFGSVSIVLLLGLIEFGMIVRAGMEVSSATRAGAQYALALPDDTEGISATVKASTGLDANNIVVTSTRFCECSDGTTADCGDEDACGGSAQHYVRVETQYNHALFIGFPGIQNPMPIARSASFRTE